VLIDIKPKKRSVTGNPASLDPATRARREQLPVALVCMPFQDHLRPSIQVGLLKSIAASHGFPADTLHLNLELAADIGVPLYESLFQHDRARGAGDWLFSLAAFGDDAPDRDGQFLQGCRESLDFTEDELVELDDLRTRRVPEYLDSLCESTDWSRYRVVGFTSTFAQTVPSLALAVALKRRHPDLTIVFGGANLEGPMGIELVRSMDCIDYAVTGEADVAFTELLVALSEGRDPAGLPAILCRRDGKVADPPPGEPFDRMDDLPTPDYREYFDRAARTGIVPEHARNAVWLPAESSRGCWWGAKRHCTFCGLNGSTMSYRSKSAARVKVELAELAAQTGTLNFGFVDNILDLDYIEQLFPVLDDQEIDYRFFFEVKANLTREVIRTLRDGGVQRIQPGIENLSSHVLGLMRKGTRSSNNVNLLRWAKYYGIDVTWNLIYGFPKETPEDYREQATLIPDLVHLQPPGSTGRIWMERFSPIFSEHDNFPLRSITPEKGLHYIYPEHVKLDQVAYFFDYELENTMPEPVYDEMKKAVTAWQEAAARPLTPTLTLHRAPDFIQIRDGRDPEVIGTHTFSGPLAELYLALMDKPLTPKMVAPLLSTEFPLEEIEAACDEFTARSLMMRDGNLFLSLALPASGWR
jgi:ribosomal peptide maturation radical SAM protein 1